MTDIVETVYWMKRSSDLIPNIIEKSKQLKNKIMKNKWNPAEGIESESEMQEQDSSITEGGFGLSSLPVR